MITSRVEVFHEEFDIFSKRNLYKGKNNSNELVLLVLYFGFMLF